MAALALSLASHCQASSTFQHVLDRTFLLLSSYVSSRSLPRICLVQGQVGLAAVCTVHACNSEIALSRTLGVYAVTREILHIHGSDTNHHPYRYLDAENICTFALPGCCLAYLVHFPLSLSSVFVRFDHQLSKAHFVLLDTLRKKEEEKTRSRHMTNNTAL